LPKNSLKNITIFAPAKINLYLHITAKRNDDYHLIESLVVFADYGDQITVTPSKKLRLKINGQFADYIKPDNNNLVIKAALLLAKASGIEPTGNITLTKNLPVSSGIGGGSADAAATLRALTELWDIQISTDSLSSLAEELGADVPICLKGVTSIVTGIGEKITPVPKLPNFWLVLVNPNVLVSTAEVFSAFRGKFLITQPFNTQQKSIDKLVNSLSQYKNNLTPASVSIAPVIKDVLEALRSTENQLLSRVSGSGATCFSLFKTKSHADAAAKELALKYPNWWIKATSIYS